MKYSLKKKALNLDGNHYNKLIIAYIKKYKVEKIINIENLK